MFKRFAPFAILALFSACGGSAEDACNDYADAAISCVETAFAGDQAAIDTNRAAFDSACAQVNSDASYFDCLADAYNGADCSTAEGFAAAGTAAAACTP